MIKAVLFDFDGTLANTLPFYLKAYDQALKSIGFNFNEKEVAQKCFGVKEIDICTSLGVPEKTEVFAQEYFSAVKELFKQAVLFKETLQILNFLKDKQIKIIIITFAYRWYIDQMMQQFNLNHYFDFIISTNDVKNPKPDPEAVITACSKLDINPSETLVVGDSKSDILMGNSAGSKTVLFTRKEYDLFYSLEELKKAKPTFIINNLLQLKEIILNN